MGKLNRVNLLNDKGDRISGTPLNDATWQALQDAVESDILSGNYPLVSTRTMTDNNMAGLPFDFGGSQVTGVIDLGYPVGATPFDPATGNTIFAPNTRIFRVDSALLLEGIYALEAMLAVSGMNVTQVGTLLGTYTSSLGLFNITDAPEVAMVEISANGYGGSLVRSGAITFPAPGATKDYAVKLHGNTLNGPAALAWGIRLVRVS
jgi:hypothetical protein